MPARSAVLLKRLCILTDARRNASYGVQVMNASSGPQCTLVLSRSQNTVSRLEQLTVSFRSRHRLSRCATHHHDTQRLRRHVRYDKEFRARLTAENHHQTVTPALHAGLPPSAGDDRAEVYSGLGVRPVDADVDDLAELPMQNADQLWQFPRHRPGVRPPRAIDIGTQLLCEREPDGSSQTPRPVQAIHEGGRVDAFWGSSEKAGFCTGSELRSSSDAASGL
jgi:hypothetical protein